MDLMMRIGPQSVTMDVVARECGISKRTLYETFPNKLTLISGVIKTHHDIYKSCFEQIFAQSENSFTALMGVYLVARKFFQKRSAVFISDIKRLYPEVFEEYKSQEIEHMKVFASIIKKAQTEGLVLEGINCDIASYIFFTTMRSIHNIDESPFGNITIAELFDGAFLNFMRGIATTEGQNIIENYVMKNLKH